MVFYMLSDNSSTYPITGLEVIPTIKCSILNETPATAWVDGGNLLGSSVAKFCMDTAIQKAKGLGSIFSY